jgi:hypothetical protein
VKDINLYAHIQTKLNGVGRFRLSDNVVKYIISDIKGINLFIKIVHGKLRTSKNITFNELISFFNKKYNLNIPESKLDISNLSLNS